MRETPLLKAVIEVLSETQKPLSVPSIQKLLTKKDITPNKTTLYRILEKLCESDQIEALLLDPKVTYYEIKTHHHHHFTCEKCTDIKCINDKNLEKNIHDLEHELQKKGLFIKRHHFSFSGLCKTCAS